MGTLSKKVERVVLVTNTAKDPDFEYLGRVYALLSAHGAEVRVPISYKGDLPASFDVSYFEEDELYRDADAAIVLGGDGTILKAAPEAIKCGTPILGVNLGRVGYMADVGLDDLDCIGRLFEGKYSISERMTLKVETEDNSGRECVYENALNDAVLHCSAIGKVQGLSVYHGGALVADHRGDGIVITTPTGSTAYSMSAGGPVLDPSLECICITPICSLSPAARPIVFSVDREISMEVARDNRAGLFLSCDGFDCAELSVDTKIIISRSEKKAKLISLDDQEFFKVLRKKTISAI